MVKTFVVPEIETSIVDPFSHHASEFEDALIVEVAVGAETEKVFDGITSGSELLVG